MNNRNAFVLPPPEFTGLQLSKPKSIAAGAKAILVSMEHVYGQAGVIRGTRAMLQLNQFHGFDCPGCAWPDPDDHRSTVEFCENGAKAVAEETTTEKANPTFFAQHSVAELSTWSDYDLGKSGRITAPMMLAQGDTHYRPVEWDHAFQIIAIELNALESPDEAIFYTSGKTSNEAAFLYQLFARQFGTNNLPDCSNMCHESSGAGLTETLGIGKGSVTLNDFYDTEVIIIMGQNPGTNHPRMLTALQEAKKNGTIIISINPLKEAGLLNFRHPQHPTQFVKAPTHLTDHYLQVRINGDVPLLKAILKLLLQKDNLNGNVLDHDFIAEFTTGFEELKKDLENYSLDDLLNQAGLPLQEVEKIVEVLADKKKIIVCWAMGLTQHLNAVDNVREIVNMLLLKGSIGKSGAGTCPVRGHSNVQGDRTVGIWEKLKPALREAMRKQFHFEPPEMDGYDSVGAIKAMSSGKARFFMGLGGNFVSAAPDTILTGNGMMKCRTTVHVSTKLNRSHLAHGEIAFILPCLGRTERDEQRTGDQFVSVENSTGVVHQSTGRKKPASTKLRSEPSIIGNLAKAVLGERSTVDWDDLIADYDHIRNAIENTINGFENYNERVRQPGGFYLPNGARERDFQAAGGKAKFTINRNPEHNLQRDEFLMMTIRSHDQFNTTIYGLHDRYRGIYSERRVLLMNAEDMNQRGINKKETVDLESAYDGIRRIAEQFIVIPYDIPSKCVATYFPEANVLVPANHYARQSHTPISKSVKVKIYKRE